MIKITIIGDMATATQPPPRFAVSDLTPENALSYLEAETIGSIASLHINQALPDSRQERRIFEYKEGTCDYIMSSELAIKVIKEAQTGPSSTILQRALHSLASTPIMSYNPMDSFDKSVPS